MTASEHFEAPFTAGHAAARRLAPANACDAHIHLYDRLCPAAPGARLLPPDASVDDYAAVQRRIGTTRVVVVTPSTYGTDNRVMLAGLRRLGDAARGIAVVDPGVTDAELDRLHQAGVRGVRFQGFRGSPDFRLDALAPLARRIADRGWHVQLHLAADAIAEHAALLRDLPAPLVIDHLGRLPQPAPFAHPAYRVIRSLLDAGRTWVKLSGAYHDSRDGAPTYADSGALARAYIDAAPERVVWGSDWPYPSASAGERPFPDTAQLFDLLADWSPDESALTRILVTNPEALYGFDTARN